MSERFPWARFLECIMVGIMLLLLYPAIYWTFLLPFAVQHGGYEQDQLVVSHVISSMPRMRGRTIQLSQAYGRLHKRGNSEWVGLPLFERVSYRDRISVFYNPTYDARWAVMGLSRRLVHWKHMERRWIYFGCFLLAYWPIVVVYTLLTIRQQTVVYLLIAENRKHDSMCRSAFSVRRCLEKLCRIGLGYIFIFAGLFKLVDFTTFTNILSSYRMFPYFTLSFFAFAIPLAEFVFGLFLFFGHWVRLSAAAVSAMLVVFIIALFQAALRGLDVSCGCFGGTSSSGPLPAILRDLLLLVPSLWLTLRARGAEI